MKMASPTLVFVIAAARFEAAPLPVLEDEGRTEQLKMAIQRPLAAAGLTEIEHGGGRQFNVTADSNGDLQVDMSEVATLTVSDSSRQVAVTVDPGGLSVRATGPAYHSHEWLFGLLDITLSALQIAQPDLRYSRLGVRYLDVLVPAPGHRPQDYLAGPFAVEVGDSDVPDTLELEEYVQVLALKGLGGRARLVAKCFRGSGAVPFPADLVDAVISPSLPDTPAGFALLDIDHFIEAASPSESLSLENVRTYLDPLHLGASDLFASLLSQHAKAEWGVTP